MNTNNNNLNNNNRRISNFRRRRRIIRRFNRNNRRRIPRNNDNNNINTNNNYNRRRNRLRGNNKIRRNQSNMYNNNNNNNINKKINELIKDVSNLTLKSEPIVNNFKTKKEIRSDKLISAMDMVRYHTKLSFFPTSLRIVNYEHYVTKNINVPAARVTYLFWMPYQFPNTPNIKIKYGDQEYNLDFTSPLMAYDATQDKMYGFYVKNTTLDGTARLISSTFKLINTSPSLNKESSFTIYKLHSPNIVPCCGSTQVGIEDAILPTQYKNYFKNLIELGNLDTIPTKMVFSANENAYIDEYNIHEGTKIFGSTVEYIGMSYQNRFRSAELNMSIAYPLSNNNEFNPNPIGENITYMIKFNAPTSHPQNYLIQFWSIWEVAPSSESGLGSMAEIKEGNKCFDKEVIKQAAKIFPIHK